MCSQTAVTSDNQSSSRELQTHAAMVELSLKAPEKWHGKQRRAFEARLLKVTVGRDFQKATKTKVQSSMRRCVPRTAD